MRFNPYRILPWAALVAGVGGIFAETFGIAAAAGAGSALRALDEQRPADALQLAGSALALDPWERKAAYTRCVALKRLEHWGDLELAARQARDWHPDGFELLLLEGEAALNAGHAQAAADVLWQAFHQTPRTKHSAGLFWRMAMLSGQAAWGAKDGRVAAAALETITLIPGDPLLAPGDKRDLLLEASAALAAAGAPHAAVAATVLKNP